MGKTGQKPGFVNRDFQDLTKNPPTMLPETGQTVTLHEPFNGYTRGTIVGQMGNRWEIRIEGSGFYIYRFSDEFTIDE